MAAPRLLGEGVRRTAVQSHLRTSHLVLVAGAGSRLCERDCDCRACAGWSCPVRSFRMTRSTPSASGPSETRARCFCVCMDPRRFSWLLQRAATGARAGRDRRLCRHCQAQGVSGTARSAGWAHSDSIRSSFAANVAACADLLHALFAWCTCAADGEVQQAALPTVSEQRENRKVGHFLSYGHATNAIRLCDATLTQVHHSQRRID